MPNLQYVSIRFGGKGKSYIYQIDHADPINVGARVEVIIPSGTRRLETVDSVTLVRPPFPVKSATLV